MEAFIFSSPRDADVYEHLRSNFRGDVDEIEASARAEKIFDNNCLDDVAEIMAPRLRELFVSESPMPIHVEGIDDIVPKFECDDVYGWLICDAIGSINFANVALAFLHNVRLSTLPPTPEIL